MLHELLLQRLQAAGVAAAAEGAEAQAQELALDARGVGGAGTDGPAVVAPLQLGKSYSDNTKKRALFSYSVINKRRYLYCIMGNSMCEVSIIF